MREEIMGVLKKIKDGKAADIDSMREYLLVE